tara:strand:- start:23 stop:250 length:228 start_codon:yes stop_codon:yes gene_type:complete
MSYHDDNNIIIEQTTGDISGGKSINIGNGGDSMGDVQAGIEFIYHMREHIVDVGVATVYLFVCYALYLYLKKVIK